MNLFVGSEPLFFPSLGPAMLQGIRMLYGVLLLATLAIALPHARRYFLSERWGGYAEDGPWVTPVQNPVVMPVLLGAWLVAAALLLAGRQVIAAALVNFLLCRYFFIQMRWKGVLRGMGAPGFIAYWLGAAVLLLELTARHAPQRQGLALLVLQVDFALIMLSAGMYKFSAGYRRNEGMELGMVNPEWGYRSRFWGAVPPGSGWFRLFNELAWSVEVVGAVLMLVPATRFIGGMMILLSFIFILTQTRLGLLCEMVIVCCLIFAFPGSLLDGWFGALLPAATRPVPQPVAWLDAALGVALWTYLALLPLARAGLTYNLHRKKAFPASVQRVLEAYTNAFGLIVWRVFSADLTNFFVRIHEQHRDGGRRLISRWGRALRYSQVAEAITVTSLFTTLKYYASNRALFVARLLRYARTVPHDRDARLVFEYVSIRRLPDRFEQRTIAEYIVDVAAGSVDERVVDPSVSVRSAAAASPIHEGVRPGSYVPLRRR